MFLTRQNPVHASRRRPGLVAGSTLLVGATLALIGIGTAQATGESSGGGAHAEGEERESAGAASLGGTVTARSANRTLRIAATRAGGVKNIGGFHPRRTPRLRAAVRVFGRPNSKHRLSDGALLRR